MGQTARLRLIRDRFIAGHGNCDLRRHLESVSPETPIRDVVDRCRYQGGCGHRTEIGPESVEGLDPADKFDRGASDSEAGGVGHRKTVTAAGEGATESATRSCKPSSTDGTGTDVMLFPRWTAPTSTATSATATYPTRLDRRGLFFLWEVRLYDDALPQLE